MMNTRTLLLLLHAFLIFPAYAQLGNAPLPTAQPVAGPTLEATQQWVVNMFKSLPVEQGIANNWKTGLRWAASFKGCNYEYFKIERHERLVYADNHYAALRYEIISGRLEDFISEQLPDGGAYIKIAGGKTVQNTQGYLEDTSKELYRFASLNESDLDFFRRNYKRSYTTDGSVLISVGDHTSSTRLVRAFLHMSKLCAAIKLEEQKPRKIVPPAGEPF